MPSLAASDFLIQMVPGHRAIMAAWITGGLEPMGLRMLRVGARVKAAFRERNHAYGANPIMLKAHTSPHTVLNKHGANMLVK